MGWAGGCACGEVRFEADVDPADATRCACGWCRAVGWWGAAVPADAFELRGGWGALVRVPGAVDRLRCGVCGCDPFGETQDRALISINVRCLDGADAGRIPDRVAAHAGAQAPSYAGGLEARYSPSRRLWRTMS